MKLSELNVSANLVLEGQYGHFVYFCEELPEIIGKDRNLITAHLKFARSLLNYVKEHDSDDLVTLERVELYVKAIQSEYSRLKARKE